MFADIKNKKIYDNTYLSFIFEFFSPVQKRSFASKLAKSTGKRIKWFKEKNESFHPTNEVFKLHPKYDSKYNKLIVETGLCKYNEAINIFLKINHIIESFGYTTNRCSVKTKIQLDTAALGLKTKMHNLNKFKYLLGLDESKIFEMWPNRKNEESKTYQNHLGFIQPKDVYSRYITERFIENMSPIDFQFPKSDFFANDFSEINTGKLSINYIGGKNYETHRKKSIETINIVVERLYETLLDNWNYNNLEKGKISKLSYKYRKVINNTKRYLDLSSNYPNIQLLVDLKADKFLIESKYNLIRDKIFKLIAFGDMESGYINFDTSRNAFQIKDANIKNNIIIEGVEFYNCELEIDAKKCLFNTCKLNHSTICESTIYSNNFIKKSKLIDCDYLGTLNIVKSSYLDNSINKIINAELFECLVKFGIFSQNSKIDDKTHIINLS